jgi:hypothetical protein
VYPGARPVSAAASNARGSVVVVVYLRGFLAGVGAENAPDVLDKAPLPPDRGGQEQGVEYRAVEALPGVWSGGNHEQRPPAGLRLQARQR